MNASRRALEERTHGRERPAVNGFLVAAARAILRFAATPLKIVRARRELGVLIAMSDRELRDIGLGRHDLVSAAALRFDHDPMAFLERAVQERKDARENARTPGRKVTALTQRAAAMRSMKDGHAPQAWHGEERFRAPVGARILRFDDCAERRPRPA